MTIIDVYIFLASQYFGVMSCIDAWVSDLQGYEVDYLVEAHALVFFSVVLVILVRMSLKNRASIRYTQLRFLYALLGRCNPVGIRILAIAVIAIYVYLREAYGSVLELSEDEQRRFNMFIPYWLASFLKLYFCFVLISAVSTACLVMNDFRRTIGVRLLLNATLLGTLIMCATSYGRTATFNILFLCAMLAIAGYGLKFSGWIFLGACGTFVIMMILYSNYYQTYRAGRGEGIPVAEALFNFESTTENLRERMTMWRFLHDVAKSRNDRDAHPEYPGQILAESLETALPKALFPEKRASVGDSTISSLYRLEATDYPSNDFVTGYADWGYLGVLFVPLKVWIVVGIASMLLRQVAWRFPFVGGAAVLLVAANLMQVEAEIVTFTLFFRNGAIVLALIGLISLCLEGPAWKRKTTGRSRRHISCVEPVRSA